MPAWLAWLVPVLASALRLLLPDLARLVIEIRAQDRLARRQRRKEGAPDATVDARTRADLDVLDGVPPREPPEDPPGA